MVVTAPMNDILSALRDIAPLHFAEDWDNVGLLIGRSERMVTRAMLTIDLSEEILDEAIDQQVDFIVTYHPVLFRPVNRITDADPEGRLLLATMNNRISVYSPHTALDAAAGGVTDWLADAIGSGYRRPLVPHEHLPSTAEVKVVTFVPHDAVDRVRDALATTGAGKIGEYDHCSFSTPGTGSFRGGEGTHPIVGEPGQLEAVPEMRLEMVCSRTALPVMVATLRQFHPYEEVPFDLYPLTPVPDLDAGVGRRVVLDQPATVGSIGELLKKHLRINRLKMTNPERTVGVVGFVPGSGADLIDTAIREAGCELFVTGEMKHHAALRAELMGCSIILTGHTNSERGYLPVLRERLTERVEEVEFIISKMDRSRFEVI